MKATHDGIVIEKASVIAYLSLIGHHCTPFVKLNGRVAFTVKGDVQKALSEMQENPQVHILDYLQRLDSTRSIIFMLKQGR